MKAGRRKHIVHPAGTSFNPLGPIKLDRTEMERAEASLKRSTMTDEDWAKHGPYVPYPKKKRSKGGGVA